MCACAVCSACVSRPRRPRADSRSVRPGGPAARQARGGARHRRGVRRGDPRLRRRPDQGDAAGVPRDGHRLVRRRRRLGHHQRPRGAARPRDAALAREPAGPACGEHGVPAQGARARAASCRASSPRPRTRSSASSSTRVLPTAKVNLTPQIFVLLSNGTRLKAEVKKYSPPVSAEPGAMSGRDLALLKIPGDNFPVLPLADSKVVQIGDPIHIIGLPGRGALARAPERVGVDGSLRDQRRRLRLQAGQERATRDPDRRPGRLGQLRRARRGRSGRGAWACSPSCRWRPAPRAASSRASTSSSRRRRSRTSSQDTPVKLGEHRASSTRSWYAGLRAFFSDDWKGAGAAVRGGRPPPAQPARRQAHAGRGAREGEEPAAAPVPVVLGRDRRDAPERGRLRRPVLHPLAAQSLPRAARPRSSACTRAASSRPSSTCAGPRPTRRCRSRSRGSVRLAPEELESGISGLELDTTRPSSRTAPDPTRRRAPGWRRSCGRSASRTCAS